MLAATKALLFVGTIWLVLIASSYLFAFEQAGMAHHRAFFASNREILSVHILSGIVALVTGPVLVFRGPVRAGGFIHRILGVIYVSAICFLAVPTSIHLSRAGVGGLASRSGFLSLSCCWFATTLLTVVRAHTKTHPHWAIRSYALTVSAISFRVFAGALTLLGLSFTYAYIAASWLWIVNLVVSEFAVQRIRRRHDPKRTRQTTERMYSEVSSN